MEPFTLRARRVLLLAQQEAERLRQNTILTEHLLLGLMEEEDSFAGRVLRESGLKPDQVRALVEQRSGSGQYEGVKIELSPGIQQALEFAVEEARRLGHPYIGTEHLLLGLMRSDEGLVVEILRELSVTTDQIRSRAEQMLEERSAPAAEPPRRAIGMERFTQRSRRVISLAHKEAERLRQNAIGTEHLLLGLIEEEGGVAGRVLRTIGLEPDRIRKMVEQTSGFGEYQGGKIDFAPGVQQILEFAVDETRRMGHHYVGTEHLLLGLVRSQEGWAVEILRKMSVTAEQIRRETLRELRGDVPALSTSFTRFTQTPRQIPFSHMARFTQQSRQVLLLAHQEAERLRQNFIRTEHLLLGLIQEENGVAGRVLRELGLKLDLVREQVEQASGFGQHQDGKIELSNGTQRVLEFAVEEARRMGYRDIGTEHLLLGLVRSSEDMAMEIVGKLGITAEQIRGQTYRILKENRGMGPSPIS